MAGSSRPPGQNEQSDVQALVNAAVASVRAVRVKFLKELEVLPAELCQLGTPDELIEALGDQPGRFVKWATLEARARAERDKLQKELEVLAVELFRTLDPGGLWKALCEVPVRFLKWAALEVFVKAYHNELTDALKHLLASQAVVQAEAFLKYQDRLTKEALIQGEIDSTSDAIRAEALLDETPQNKERLALAEKLREVGSALEQITPTRAEIEQSQALLTRLSSDWSSRMSAQPVVPSSFRLPGSVSALAGPHAKRGGVRKEEVGYLGTDNLPKFREYVDLVRQDVVLWEHLHEWALVKAAFQKFDIREGTSAGSAHRRERLDEFQRELDKDFTNVFEQLPPGAIFGDLLLCSMRPIDYGAVAARVRQLGNRLEGQFGPTQITSELAHSPVPSHERWPLDDDRLAAGERIVEWIGHVIYPLRWHWVKKVLDELADLHGREANDELRRSLIANLFEAVEVAGEYTLAEEDKVRRALRARLNKLATVDLLGPGWRHARHEVDPEEARPEMEERELDASEPNQHKVEPAKPEQRGVEPKRAGPVFRNRVASKAARAKAALEAEIVGRVEIERLFAAAKLTDREAEVVSEVARLGGEHGATQAVAEKLGIAPATARVLLSKARKKLAAARKTLTATDQ